MMMMLEETGNYQDAETSLSAALMKSLGSTFPGQFLLGRNGIGFAGAALNYVSMFGSVVAAAQPEFSRFCTTLVVWIWKQYWI